MNSRSHAYTQEQIEWFTEVKHISPILSAQAFNKYFGTKLSKNAIGKRVRELSKFQPRAAGEVIEYSVIQLAWLKQNATVTAKKSTKKFNRHFGTNASEYSIKKATLPFKLNRTKLAHLPKLSSLSTESIKAKLRQATKQNVIQYYAEELWERGRGKIDPGYTVCIKKNGKTCNTLLLQMMPINPPPLPNLN